MRLHHLTMRAFGPFAETAEIDFDELHEAGLFLLAGPTGAGKTSILDAVCFALYGSVPGARGVKALRSQHADPQTAPEVVLDFSIRGRRFVLRRSPEWTRPKRRGEGTTAEKARATLLETTSGQEHLLSSRAQEVGHLVSGMIGMNAAQFQQVAMLPQGEFQTFLRATSQERHAVLQQLFHTDRFSRIEDWVHEHSRGLRERAEGGRRAVQRCLDAVADRAGVPLPDELADDQLALAAEQDQVLPWVETVLTDAQDEEQARRVERDLAASAAEQARVALEEARRLQELHDRRRRAQAELDALEQEQPAAEEARSLLDADARAERCRPVLTLLDEAVAEERRQQQAHDEATTELRAAAGPDEFAGREIADAQLTDSDIGAVEESARERLARLDSVRPRVGALREAEETLRAREARLAEIAQRQETLHQELDRLPEEVTALRDQVTDLGDPAAAVERLRQDLTLAEEQLTAARETVAAAAHVMAAEDDVRSARDAAADARQHVQELTAARLAGIAAELAGRLTDGDPCQVCGSREHPAPAEAAPDAVTAEAQQVADADYDRRSRELAAQQALLQEARAALATVQERARGLDPVQARERRDRVRQEVEEATAAGAERTRLASRLEAVEVRLEFVRTEVAALATEAAELGAAVAALRGTAAGLREEIGRATGDDQDSDAVPRAHDRATACLEAAIAARRSATAYADSVERLRTARDRTDAALTEHGFDSVDDARTAHLADEMRTRLRELLDARQQAAVRAQSVLDDPEVGALPAEAPAAGLDDQSRAVTETAAATAAAARAHTVVEERVAALREQRARLVEASAAWAPARAEFVRADAMARLVRGTGSDNQLQMRLSAYVLATRLDQVVAAANERLSHLRDQRYVLQRSDKAARRGSQAGLGLEVLDQWTGDARDPSTLSGGETFVVSLSLALGLADVVTNEAGGTEIETLFVDEGFGSLDAEMLDDVMDRLDELRAGGRSVGVVSHVTEMLNRIPAQVHVHKHRHGSTVEVRTLVG